MKVVNLDVWEQFEEAIADLESDLERRGEKSRPASERLFRGHGNEKWKLETTMDRFFSRPVSLSDYFQIARRVKPQVEVFTGSTWSIPTSEQYEQYLRSLERYICADYPAVEYFAYLRHHGFPSPLLDWTASPYVAAFFAFRNQEKVERVSIYVYVEYDAGGMKSGSGSEPYIDRLPSSIKTHKRHFLQQSRYTICTFFRAKERYYGAHEEVVAPDDQGQDLLWKFNMPAEERRKVLAKLQRMNVTAFSLFGSEESLLEMMAVNEIFLKGLTSNQTIQTDPTDVLKGGAE